MSRILIMHVWQNALFSVKHKGSAEPLTYTNSIQNDAVVAFTGAVQNIAKYAVCYPAASVGYSA